MKKIFFLIYAILLINSIIAEDLSNEEFQEKLNQFKTTGDITLFTQSQNTLSSQQQTEVIKAIPDQKEFWNKWKSLDSVEKNKLWDKLSSSKNEFLTELSKNYGFEMKGFDETTNFGIKGSLGNKEVYIDAEAITEFNKNAGEQAIQSIEYKNTGNQRILVITKKNGAVAEISVEEGMDGYYFDPKTSKIVRMQKQSDGTKSLNDDPSTGVWNGKGNLKIQLSKTGSKISLQSDKEQVNYKTKENSYWTYKDPLTGKLLNGEITIGKDGKLSNIDNIFINGKTFGGYFGKDVDVLYNFDEYQKLSVEDKLKLGSHIVIDGQKKVIAADVARTEGGVVSTVEKYIKEHYGDVKNDVLKVQKDLKKLEKAENLAKKYESLPNFLGGGDAEDFVGWARATPEILGGPNAEERGMLEKFPPRDGEKPIDYINRIKREGVAEKSGIKTDSLLMNMITSDKSIGLIKNVVDKASVYLTAADLLIYSGSDLKAFESYPILKTMIPAEGTRIDLQISNQLARNIDNVYMDAGTLTIQNNAGKYVPIISQTTPFNYHTDPLLQSKTYAQFSGINMVLRKNANNIEQWLKSNDYGSLVVEGVGAKNLETAGSQSFYAQGSIYLHGPFGKIGKEISQSDGIMRLELKADPETIKKANDYLYKSEDTQAYRQAYNEYKNSEGGFSSEEKKALNNMAAIINSRYHQFLAEGDSGFAITALSQTKPQEFPNKIFEAGQTLEQFSKTKTKTTSQLPVSFDYETMNYEGLAAAQRLWNNKQFQGTAANSGIDSFDEFMSGVKKHAGELGYFLRTNSGSSIEYREDSKNRLYQIKYGGNTFNVDPLYGEVISDLLPTAVTSTGIDSSNRVYIDNNPWNNRFTGNRETVISFDLGSYRPLEALQSKSSLEEAAKNIIAQEVGNSIKEP